jgi:orotate phosphoribosyltransferase
MHPAGQAGPGMLRLVNGLATTVVAARTAAAMAALNFIFERKEAKDKNEKNKMK